MGLFAHDIFDYFQNFKQKYLKSQLACDFKVSAIRYGNVLDNPRKGTSMVAISPSYTKEWHHIVDRESEDIVHNSGKPVLQLGIEVMKSYTKPL